jgi:hypothetical protein
VKNPANRTNIRTYNMDCVSRIGLKKKSHPSKPLFLREIVFQYKKHLPECCYEEWKQSAGGFVTRPFPKIFHMTASSHPVNGG